MTAQVIVEITEQRIPPEAVAQRRDQAIRNLSRLGMIDADKVERAEPDPAGTLVGYALTVNGITLPVAVSAYEVVATERGPAVVVTLPASSVTIGETKTVPTTPEGRAAGTWGAPRPDPRENFPGWKKPEANRG